MRGGQRAPGVSAGRSAGMRGAGCGGRQCLREDYTGRLPTCPNPAAAQS